MPTDSTGPSSFDVPAVPWPGGKTKETMKKNLMLVGMGTSLDREGAEKLKANLRRDLVDREIRIITGALFIQEVIVNLDRGQTQPFLIIGMGISIDEEHADKLREEIKTWLPDHEVKFIVSGLASCLITVDVETESAANRNGYL